MYFGYMRVIYTSHILRQCVQGSVWMMMMGNVTFFFLFKRCVKRWLRKGAVITLFPAESLFHKVSLMLLWRIFLYSFLSQRNKNQSSFSSCRREDRRRSAQTGCSNSPSGRAPARRGMRRGSFCGGRNALGVTRSAVFIDRDGTIIADSGHPDDAPEI